MLGLGGIASTRATGRLLNMNSQHHEESFIDLVEDSMQEK